MGRSWAQSDPQIVSKSWPKSTKNTSNTCPCVYNFGILGGAHFGVSNSTSEFAGTTARPKMPIKRLKHVRPSSKSAFTFEGQAARLNKSPEQLSMFGDHIVVAAGLTLPATLAKNMSCSFHSLSGPLATLIMLSVQHWLCVTPAYNKLCKKKWAKELICQVRPAAYLATFRLPYA